MKSVAGKFMQEGISNRVGDFIAKGVGNLGAGQLVQVKNDRCLLMSTVWQIYD